MSKYRRLIIALFLVALLLGIVLALPVSPETASYALLGCGYGLIFLWAALVSAHARRR